MQESFKRHPRGPFQTQENPYDAQLPKITYRIWQNKRGGTFLEKGGTFLPSQTNQATTHCNGTFLLAQGTFVAPWWMKRSLRHGGTFHEPHGTFLAPSYELLEIQHKGTGGSFLQKRNVPPPPYPTFYFVKFLIETFLTVWNIPYSYKLV